MDTFGHTIIGLAIAALLDKVVTLPVSGLSLFWLVLGLAFLPDIDRLAVIATFISPTFKPSKWTHSLVVATVFAVVVPLFFWTGTSYLVMVLLFFTQLAAHILVDVFGNWIFKPLWPLSNKEVFTYIRKSWSPLDMGISAAFLIVYLIIGEMAAYIGAVFWIIEIAARWLGKLLLTKRLNVMLVPSVYPWLWWGVIAKQHGTDYNEISYFKLGLFDKELPPKRQWISSFTYQHRASLPLVSPLDVSTHILSNLEAFWGSNYNFPVFRMVTEEPFVMFWYYVETIFWKWAWGAEVKVEPDGSLKARMKLLRIDAAPGLLPEGASQEPVVPTTFQEQATMEIETAESSVMLESLGTIASQYFGGEQEAASSETMVAGETVEAAEPAEPAEEPEQEDSDRPRRSFFD